MMETVLLPTGDVATTRLSTPAYSLPQVGGQVVSDCQVREEHSPASFYQ